MHAAQQPHQFIHLIWYIIILLHRYCNSNSPSIKPETAAAAALQSALSLSTPMNVNVSMNFNSHNIQYSATGYNVQHPSTNINLPYEPFYNSNRYIQFIHHTIIIQCHQKLNLVRICSTKQAMLYQQLQIMIIKIYQNYVNFFQHQHHHQHQ